LLALIFKISLSASVILRKDVPLGVSKTKFYTLTPFSKARKACCITSPCLYLMQNYAAFRH